jgi:hypothetical protein
MSIVCQCPYCAKSYKLKDELLGKKVNCNNPKCGKSFPVVAVQEVAAGPTGPAINQAELDALAAAAFSDEPVQEKPKEQEQIEVTCAGCDHKWTVGIDKEGKNAPCPECRKVNRVPMRVKAKQVDWRSDDNSGRPKYAKIEQPKVEGAIDAANVTAVSMEGAREILKQHEEPEEPSVVRKRWAKRILLGIVLVGGLGYGIFSLATARKEIKTENLLKKAAEEVANKDHGYGDKAKQFHAIVLRSAAEHRARDAKTQAEFDTAHTDIKSARNDAKGATLDHAAMLAETALTVPALLEAGNRIDDVKPKAKQFFLTELRQTLQFINEQPDLLHDTLRGVTRKLVERQQTMALVDVAGLASQLGKDDLGKGEAIAQVGLELVRLGKKAEADEIFEKHRTFVTPSMVGLRLALGKPAAKGQETAPVARIAEAESAALLGDGKKAIDRATAGPQARPDEKIRALIAVAHALVDVQPAQAADAADKASKLIIAPDAKGQVTPWVIIRACRVLARAGKPDEAEKLADSLPDAQSKAWGKLEAMRGRMLQGKDKKGDDQWLDSVGDPTKQLAAAKAREELARHNAKLDGSYQKAVELWTRGTIRPFGYAGIVLGQQDHDVDR